MKLTKLRLLKLLSQKDIKPTEKKVKHPPPPKFPKSKSKMKTQAKSKKTKPPSKLDNLIEAIDKSKSTKDKEEDIAAIIAAKRKAKGKEPMKEKPKKKKS